MPIILLAVIVGGILLWRRRNKEPAHAKPAIGALPWAEDTNWGVVAPLARAESRQLLRHPAFIVGVLLSPVILFAATGDDNVWIPSWGRLSTAVALGLVPLGWLTITASNLLALRPRRSGAEELLAATPAPQPTRTLGLLCGPALAAAAVAMVLAAVWVVLLVVVHDPTGTINVADIAAGVLIVAGAVTVGVSVARFLPHAVFGIAAVFAVIMIQARFFELDAWPWHRTEADPIRFLSFLGDPTSVTSDVLAIRPAWSHVLYLLGLIAIMGCVALAKDGLARPVLVVGGVAIALTVVAGWLQLRPPSDAKVAAMLSFLTEPRAHQTCTTADATVYCAYPEHLPRVPEWQQQVTSIRAMLPAAVASRPLTVSDRVPTIVGNDDCAPMPFLETLHPSLAKQVTPDAIWPLDADVHPGTDTFACSSRSVHELFTAIQVGSSFAGLKPSPHGLDVRCNASGQARAAIALWLGAATSPQGPQSLRSIIDEHGSGLATFSGWNDPPMFGATFATADMELALAMQRLPVSTVAAAVAGSWDTLVNPATPSETLGQLLALDQRGAPLGSGSGESCR